MCEGVKNCNRSMQMNLEAFVGLAVSALLLIYLVFALLRPEKF
jgi:K+-transporting ATPase KdpF subunit